MFKKGQADFDAKFREYVQPMLQSGEEIQGIVNATHQTAFKMTMYVIATTNQRLIFIPVKNNNTPKGDPIFITPDQIVKTHIPGTTKGSLGQALKLDDSIKIETADHKFKLEVLSSGGLDRLFTGQEQATGSQALYDFLVAIGR